MPKLTVLLILSLVLGACSSGPSPRAGNSTASAEAGTPQRVTYISYSSGQRLELVNEAHTGRVEQYSRMRADASRKVQTNDVMDALVEVLEDNGFARFASVGPAPDERGALPWALELEEGGNVRYIGAVPGLSKRDKQQLLRLATAFVDTYNATYGLQSVQLKPGESPFSNPAAGRRN